MIITLTKADFSSCKIGTLTTFNVRKSTVIGASVNIIKTSVERAGYSSATTIATIVLDEANYEGHAIKVMMGSTDVSSWYSVGNVIVPANTPITSNITISVSATAVSGGDNITVLYPLAIDSTSHNNFTSSKVPVIIFTDGYPLLKTNNFNYIRFISEYDGKCQFYKYTDAKIGASLSNINKTLIGEMDVTVGYNTCKFDTTKLNENETLGVVLTKTSGGYPMYYIQEMNNIPDVEQRIFAYSTSTTGAITQMTASTSGSNLEVGFNPDI